MRFPFRTPAPQISVLPPAQGGRHAAAYEPMRELSLDELDDLPYAGLAMAQDTAHAAQGSRDASNNAWSLLPLLPTVLTP